jgi:hypothetical protein
MIGLFYHAHETDQNAISLLRFYENGYVIYKKINGNTKEYISRQLRLFSMDGHVVKGEPEFTFCGAYEFSSSSKSFKIENEITNPSDSWVQKDVLSFKGSIINENELLLKSVSKRTKFETENTYKKITDQALLEKF